MGQSDTCGVLPLSSYFSLFSRELPLIYEPSGGKTTKNQTPQKTTGFSGLSKLNENLSCQRVEKRF